MLWMKVCRMIHRVSETRHLMNWGSKEVVFYELKYDLIVNKQVTGD